MDDGADVNGANQPTEVTSRVPDSPGSRSNYGEFYWYVSYSKINQMKFAINYQLIISLLLLETKISYWNFFLNYKVIKKTDIKSFYSINFHK